MAETSADAEAEEFRVIRLNQMDENEPGWRDHFVPGSFGCHELLDRLALYQELIGDLTDHPAAILNPDWYRKLLSTGVLLNELYQAVGAVHLPAEFPR